MGGKTTQAEEISSAKALRQEAHLQCSTNWIKANVAAVESRMSRVAGDVRKVKGEK